MCDVDDEAVVAAVDAPSIYDIPKVLHREGLDAYVVRRLGLPFRDVDWTDWDELLRRVHQPEHEVKVALVGKYIDLPDAYLSVTEALRAGGFAHDARVRHPLGRLRRVRDPRRARQKALGGVDAVCVPGGFGVRGIEGKLGALRYAREQPHPDAGPVPGPAVHGHRVRPQRRRPRGRELDRVRPRARPHPVIATMEEQKAFVEGAGDLGGTMRLGAYPAELAEGSLVAAGLRRDRTSTSGTATATRSTTPTASALEEAGLVFSGTHPDRRLVEFVELPRDVHPYYVATQAHPEFRSRPTRAHPLFAGLVGAAIERPAGRAAGRGRAPRATTRPSRRDAEPLRDRLDPRPVLSAVRSFHGAGLGRRHRGGRPRRGRRRATATTSSTPAPSRSWRSTRPSGCVLVQQYRHPVGAFEWELPAGLLDVDGEPRAPDGAPRELHEEADLTRGGVAPAARPLRQPRRVERGTAGVPRPRPARRARG